MPLSTGDKLGPYEILAPLGAGGMGQVFRARDTRLNRDVAVKTSSTQFSERFEREARAIAALNHPHICHLYDVGPDYLVMEYVEGAQLKGPLPLDQTLKYAAQICDALDAAHKKGITHRDLKPANILVTKAGIKLLDFGLAKMAQATKPIDDATVTMALTGKNEIVGTLYYMSPEQLQSQANGQEIDSRSDIFSFGLVLYELLTGKRAMDGTSPASVIAAIMERPAPSIADVAPAALDWVLKRCLEKDPDNRWQSARDLKAALERIANAQAETTPAVLATQARSIKLPWAATAAAVVFAIGGSWAAYRATRPTETKPFLPLDVDLGPDVSLGSTAGVDTTISPDGTRLAYISQGKLFIRKLDQPKATELTGAGDVDGAPFFSPDGQWVAFFGNQKLKKISVEGGAAIVLSDGGGRNGSWGDDGNIITETSSRLVRTPSAGGERAALTPLAQEEQSQRFPHVLPGGKAVLFTSCLSLVCDYGNIDVLSLPGQVRKRVQPSSSFGRYVPAAHPDGTGHLLYMSKGTLFAVGFDLEKLETTGAAVPFLEDVAPGPLNSFLFDVASGGSLVYRSQANSGGVSLQWIDPGGKARPLLAKPGAYRTPRLSPGMERVVFEDKGDLWIHDTQRDLTSKLTFDGGNSRPIWSPDGRYIVFTRSDGLYWMRSDGANKPQSLRDGNQTVQAYSFSADERHLTGVESEGGVTRIWTANVESDSNGFRPLKAEPFLRAIQPAFSPDGRWLAYTSTESGNYQVYVRAFPDKGGKWQISDAGGVYPIWSRNGRELYFLSQDNRIMATGYTVNGDSFLPGKPRRWSETQLPNAARTGGYTWDVAADGKRAVALMPADEQGAQWGRSHVVLLLNLADELERRAPAGK